SASSHARTDALTCPRRRRACNILEARSFQSRAESQMATSRMLDERSPHRGGHSMLDQEMPEAIRALVQIAHRQIGEHRARIRRTPPPDRRVREQPVVAPRVTAIELLA